MGLGAAIVAFVLRIGRQFFEFRGIFFVVPTFLQGAHVHFVVLALATWITGHDFAPFACIICFELGLYLDLNQAVSLFRSLPA